MQNNQHVPGEDEIEVTPAEQFAYANVLAIKNGFSPIAADQPEKDPNHVLPGDRLMLPDGRILMVQPRQYIYDIAAQEYRRDMARIAALEKQIKVLDSVYRRTQRPEIKRTMDQRLSDVKRLAVTPVSMRRYAALLDSLK